MTPSWIQRRSMIPGSASDLVAGVDTCWWAAKAAAAAAGVVPLLDLNWYTGILAISSLDAPPISTASSTCKSRIPTVRTLAIYMLLSPFPNALLSLPRTQGKQKITDVHNNTGTLSKI